VASNRFFHSSGIAICGVLLFCAACGEGPQLAPPAERATPRVFSVSVSPPIAMIEAGRTQQFSASTQGSGSYDPSVTWFVNDVQGGNATLGTISSAGLYTAPRTTPSPATVTVKAASKLDPARSATAMATVTLHNDPAVSWRSFLFTGDEEFVAVTTDSDGNVYASTVPVARTMDAAAGAPAETVGVVSLNSDLTDRWRYSGHPAVWSMGQALTLTPDESRVRLAGVAENLLSLRVLDFDSATGAIVADQSCRTATDDHWLSGNAMRIFDNRLHAAVGGPRIVVTADLDGPLDCTQQFLLEGQAGIGGLWVARDHILATGTSNCPDSPQGCSYLWKLDRSGNLLWSKLFRDTHQLHVAESVESHRNAIYVAGTLPQASGPVSFFVQKLDIDGKGIWPAPLVTSGREGSCSPASSYLSELIPSPAGGVTLLGSTDSLDCRGADFLALLISPEGSVVKLLRGELAASAVANAGAYDSTGSKLFLVGNRSPGPFSPVELVVASFQVR